MENWCQLSQVSGVYKNITEGKVDGENEKTPYKAKRRNATKYEVF